MSDDRRATDPFDDDDELDDEDDDAEDEAPIEGTSEGIPQDMVELLEETADLDDPVEVSVGADGTTYLLGGRPFAWARALAFEVQLGPDIAAAALRTPDVSASTRGAGWIRLEPTVVEDHAADRVVAWFEMARRIAVGRQAKPGKAPRH